MDLQIKTLQISHCESDGFTTNNTETVPKILVNPNITLAHNNSTDQALNFNTQPPVKRIAKPISIVKPQKNA